MADHSDVVRTMSWSGAGTDLEPLLTREWLVTNGLGGYASGTVAGVATRRYHGLLIAALPGRYGRTMMLNHLSEHVRLPDGREAKLGGDERASGELSIPGAEYLREFRLELGLPVWRFEVGGFLLEKRVALVHRQNTVHVTYRVLRGDGPVRLKIRPSVHFRSHDAPVSADPGGPYRLIAQGDHWDLRGGDRDLPPLRMRMLNDKAALTLEPRTSRELLFRVEEDRGYEHTGERWSPGVIRVELSAGEDATLIASAEPWVQAEALSPAVACSVEQERRRRLLLLAHPSARTGPAAELVLAADTFLITPVGRAEDAARAHAHGDEVRSVIAGYHWFTDWGRDTMISLEGLTLVTGRHDEAGFILRTFAQYVRDGLIPNMFPEGQSEGVYHTADATLWFFHAIERYVRATGDRLTLRQLLPTLRGIVEKHLAGTRFGIHVDPSDGLLHQGQSGYQLTWMDAKFHDWVVTPRRGKAVEINALWYNALRLLEAWLRGEGDAAGAQRVGEHARRAEESFNRRFWCERAGHLFDVVDCDGGGDDPSCRPNQIFAISLDHPVLDRARWKPVLSAVREKLLTPLGLRSLSRDSPDYKPNYHGDLKTRDAAYHQGTVWSWLIGPYVDAWLRVYPEDRAGGRKLLQGLIDHLGEACLGNVSEVFDAEPPYTPRGCVAQAWGVAEALRAWVRTSSVDT